MEHLKAYFSGVFFFSSQTPLLSTTQHCPVDEKLMNQIETHITWMDTAQDTPRNGLTTGEENLCL